MLAIPSFISGLGMMGPPSRIEQVNVEIRKCGDNLKHKRKVQAVRNSRTTLEYI